MYSNYFTHRSSKRNTTWFLSQICFPPPLKPHAPLSLREATSASRIRRTAKVACSLIIHTVAMMSLNAARGLVRGAGMICRFKSTGTVKTFNPTVRMHTKTISISAVDFSLPSCISLHNNMFSWFIFVSTVERIRFHHSRGQLCRCICPPEQHSNHWFPLSGRWWGSWVWFAGAGREIYSR